MDAGVMRELLARCGGLGVLAPELPGTWGGGDGDFLTNLLLTENLSRYASFGIAYSVQSGLALWPVAYLGSDRQRARWLPELASGRRVASFAVTEPGAGSDVASLRTSVRRSARGLLVSGEKMWISNAGIADLFVTFARREPGGHGFVLVERDREGVMLGPEEAKMGLHGSSTRRVHFDSVRIPECAWLGDPAEGLASFRRMINLGRSKVGAASVGLCKEALSIAASHALCRRQFGRAIAGFGAVQHKLGEMLYRTYETESVAYRVAGAIDDLVGEGLSPRSIYHLEDLSFEISALKVIGSEALAYVADEALQIHGALGFSSGSACERIYRDARIFRIFEGTNEINRLIACDALLARLRRPGSGVESEPAELEPQRGILLELLADARRTGALKPGGPQELRIGLADLAFRIFAAESVLLRLQRLPDRADATAREALAAVAVDRAWRAVETSLRHALPWIHAAEGLDERWRALAARVVPPAAGGVRRALASAVLEGVLPAS
jgi:hypothetical protein